MKLNFRVPSFLLKRLQLFTIEFFIISILFLTAVFGFFILVNNVFNLNKLSTDLLVFERLIPLRSEFLTSIMVMVTHFGSSSFLIIANILLGVYFLLFLKHRWYSIKVPVVALGSVTMMKLLKLYFSRPRPDSPLIENVLGYSFPSGHSMSAMTFYGLLVYLIWKSSWLTYWKIISITGLLLFIVLIGFSRIYLRVHYFSDVIAGLSIGIIWLVLSIGIINQIEKQWFSSKEITSDS